MTVIKGNVGKGCASQLQDAKYVQGFLNRWLVQDKKKRLVVDGNAGKNTVAAIEWFQKEYVKMATPDGVVRLDSDTLRKLITLPGNPAPETATQLPVPLTAGDGTSISEAKIEWAAKELGAEVAAIRAVIEVETGGVFFTESGRPKILYERHYFSRLTAARYNADFSNIANAVRGGYGASSIQYAKLEVAMLLDREAALKSASWGAFQIMGENHSNAGYDTVEAFVTAMHQSADEHLAAFVGFVKASSLAGHLKNKKWASFAKGYNGPKYEDNAYDTKLETAYKKFAEEAEKEAAKTDKTAPAK